MLCGLGLSNWCVSGKKRLRTRIKVWASGIEAANAGRCMDLSRAFQCPHGLYIEVRSELR